MTLLDTGADDGVLLGNGTTQVNVASSSYTHSIGPNGLLHPAGLVQ